MRLIGLVAIFPRVLLLPEQSPILQGAANTWTRQRVHELAVLGVLELKKTQPMESREQELLDRVVGGGEMTFSPTFATPECTQARLHYRPIEW
jgi:hypothetical protein